MVDNMRTFDEINADIRKNQNNKEIIKELKKEKQKVWDALYEGHRNFKI